MKLDDNEKSEDEIQITDINDEIGDKSDQMTFRSSEEDKRIVLNAKERVKNVKESIEKEKTVQMTMEMGSNRKLFTGYITCVLCIVFSIIAIMLYPCYVYMFTVKEHSHLLPSYTLEKSFKEIKSEYSEQYNLSWKIVKSAVKSVLNNAFPESPAVVLLLGMKENENRIKMITNKLAKIIAKSFNESHSEYTDFDLNKLASISDYVEVKKEITKTINTSVEQNKHNVLVIHHLEEIPAKGAMAFHSFCDHENAPYQKVVYLFRACISEMPLKEDSKSFDSIGARFLNQIWEKDLDEDKRNALITRLTTAVAVFK
ncbi:torsin-1A-interacting protein 1-like [Tachypleus tridentatus]|uniref:torsin-1A-interacting protein 1-like n=1 Tax=Tachypleus tridentatus TaxID=6853 RepID=UPI003FD1B38D